MLKGTAGNDRLGLFTVSMAVGVFVQITGSYKQRAKQMINVSIYRLQPEPWVGLAVPYSPELTDAMKTAVDLKAFDRLGKTWWFPRSYEPVVTTLVKEHVKGVNDQRLQAARSMLYLQKGNRATDDDYAKLGLHSSAPEELIELTMNYWRGRFAQFGAPTSVLHEMEESYARIYAMKGDGA